MDHRTEQEIMRNWEGVIDLPLVSVCCITYNHEQYIAEAIDGFLMQKTDFPFEILIRDDCSTDKTAEIVKEYANKYPSLIKPVFEKENTYSKGVRPMAQLYKIAQGKYFALCEGDDYWTDPLKLQKQVKILEENEAISLIFDNARIDYYDDDHVLTRQYNFHDSVASGYVHPSQLHLFKRMTATAGVIFRKVNVHEFLNIMTDFLRVGDTPAFTYLGKFGRLYYHNNVSSVYRQTSTGAVRTYVYPVEEALKDVKYYKFLSVYFSEFNLKEPLKYPLCDMYYLVAFGYIRKNDYMNFIKYIGYAFLTKPLYMFKKVIFQLLKKIKIIPKYIMIRKKEELITATN